MRRIILLAAAAALIATSCSGDEATETFGTPAGTGGPNLADAIRSNAAANPDNPFDPVNKGASVARDDYIELELTKYF